MILKNIIPDSVMTTLRSYFTNLFVEAFNPNNTDRQPTSVAINAKSGVATFDTPVSAATVQSYAITNTYVTEDTHMSMELCYPTSGALGIPMIAFTEYASGLVTIVVYNASATDNTNEPIVVKFNIQ